MVEVFLKYNDKIIIYLDLLRIIYIKIVFFLIDFRYIYW